ncbi:MAG: mannose-6-phosphate isomerase, class I [Bacteroidetes bacterium]|nr:MAG: mannose-6-phosphate isomerase, class I [Bacteroidota bacterium]
MYKLSGKIQHYTWGGFKFIPDLLGVSNLQNEPYAEYWMGAHPASPSMIDTGEGDSVRLDQWIANDPEKILGKGSYDEFGSLPFLFKVLDVKDMLSIQVHPNKDEALKGFILENEKGIPVQASHRNYKDQNHKPEVAVALGDFWLLHGFKPQKELVKTLENIEEFNFLLPVFKNEGYYGLYKKVMEFSSEETDKILAPLMKKISAEYEKGRLSKADPAYWAGKAVSNLKEFKNLDRGIFSIYFFNLLHLKKGEAIFQGAGVPHAYLEGQNIELMSNSDNVLRGGLTTKHIDVKELMKHILFEGVDPFILKGEQNGSEYIYKCPVPDFVVSRIKIKNGTSYNHRAGSAEICIVLSGEVVFYNGNKKLAVQKGGAVFIEFGENYSIETETQSEIYKAGVPE